jgi:demethylmenaquinone methyltransferase/2-methoxy-6-polyprenyl-1,4-benzoquinol methylase
MFGAIADRYDFLNHLLSANIDRRWRNACLREIEKRITVSHPRILDIGCGTADLSLLFSKLGSVVGCDFCLPMLRIGLTKASVGVRQTPISLLGADALALPFAANSFDIAVSAFVLRNLADPERGLREMRRLLRPGGVVGILDFGMPRVPWIAALFRLYFVRILPRIGSTFSGVEGAYRYLPASVQAFPPVERLKEAVERAGFVNVEYRRLTAGIAVLLVGTAGQE